MISVLIADDQALVREGLRLMLDAEPDITVVGEAENGNDALAKARGLDPDVVLMDVRMPELDGLEATARLVKAGTGARPDVDDLRPRRVRLSRDEGGCQRVPAEGRQARAAGDSGPHRGGGRLSARPGDHAAADRGLLPPTPAADSGRLPRA